MWGLWAALFWNELAFLLQLHGGVDCACRGLAGLWASHSSTAFDILTKLFIFSKIKFYYFCAGFSFSEIEKECCVVGARLAQPGMSVLVPLAVHLELV